MIDDNQNFGIIERVSTIDHRIEMLHNQFAVEKMPDYSIYNMTGLWHENRELRLKILLCQREYVKENERKNLEARRYIELLRDMDLLKRKHEKQISQLKNIISEIETEYSKVVEELKASQEIIFELKNMNLDGDKNDGKEILS